jgi:hypothetical protein
LKDFRRPSNVLIQRPRGRKYRNKSRPDCAGWREDGRNEAEEQCLPKAQSGRVEVALAHHAQAIVVGSYAGSSELVFVNIKVIQPNTNYMLAGYDFVLRKDGIMRSMLTNS